MRRLQRLTLTALTALTLTLGTATILPAQPAAMVKDIGTAEVDFPFATFRKLVVGGIGYFLAKDGIHGMELWRTDGTLAGTYLIRDVCPGACWGAISYAVTWNGKVYFAGDDGASGIELFESDGTSPGTRLVKDVAPGLASGFRRGFFATADRLYFVGWTAEAGEELWTSLGTEVSTQLVENIHATADSGPRGFAELPGSLLFFADDGTHGSELWKTSGVPGTTEMVADLVVGPGDTGTINSTEILAEPFTGRWRVRFGNEVLFFASTPSGNALWRTDGTAAGTEILANSPLGGSFRWLVPWNGSVYFISRTGGLMKTDGTAAGTTLVAPGEFSNLYGPTFSLLMWGAESGTGYEPWRSDGTASGTALIADIVAGPTGSVSGFNGFFDSGVGFAYFSVDDGVHGVELWRTDGTAAGTDLVRDLVPGPASSIYNNYWMDPPVPLGGGSSFYLARASSDTTHPSLILTDGSSAGTAALVKIDRQASAEPLWYYFQGLFRGNPSGFSAGAHFGEALGDLWYSDGTPNGTLAIAPGNGDSWIPIPATEISGRQFIVRANGNNVELWSSDGTVSGFGLLGSNFGQVQAPKPLPVRNGFAYFSQGDDLWRSDGTAIGTSLVETNAGSPLAVSGGTLFLLRTTGTPELRRWDFAGPSASIGNFGWVQDVLHVAGHDLFLTDTELREITGTTTSLVATLPCSSVGAATPLGVFFGCDGELWISDGTSAGTHMLVEIAPGSRPSDPQFFVSSSTRVFFSADDGVHGRELWVSDGTAAGTQMVVDLVPGPGSSVPEQLTVVDGLLLFAATDGVNGKELWVSNGTAAGTQMLQNIAPGAASSTPHEFTVGADRVFFLANDTVHGFELWSMTRSAFTLASPPAAAAFFTLTPCRLVDSRSEGGALQSGTVRALPTRGRCGIPDSARSLAVNVTTVSATSSGTLTLGSNDSQFASAALPIAAGITRATQFQLRLSPSGDGTFHLGAALVGGGSVDFIVDVVGYFE